MKTYLITYDLIKPETSADYTRLFANIKSHISWAKPMASVWLIKTNRSKKEIMRLLRSAADSNDKFLVIEVTNDWISFNLSDAVVAWMKSKI
ncbi:MAG: hypothetical protein UY47_C0004G0044 [Parcubacteria group bacterium GW2011_GWB1_49_7]|uniref:SinR family protein n=1 Tax=Candidatus Zambryskibacteria bacterium RIFCSPHIGHO2_01_FULL_46_25 TaxID=1802738 RepID=A0A1G2T043_9BACT|nr:MAG: hypothetical protein UX71_C0002G0068 [Parcubacteria group bacterium GW2011_GWA1_47_10]KKW09870.1 MAG: hypothetical protein UY47_C0004G0044 [Parcubacteria group bacterium GW2011_GWB1_49_7]OHA90645.1 MAG: hypothetical protein A2838_02925 [Candidatus Zambryskibacteria bacterium RIFCSPHIGHO2_01_FULL_46_25]OHB07288.1 MAG: hypothetical protein A3A31_02065 [Candidatus Zambryskibacteria bacterium RIFCSPLOWO2_01_FULL_48_25]